MSRDTLFTIMNINGDVVNTDLFSALFQDRIIQLCDDVTDESAKEIISALLYLDSCEVKPINLYINSRGGCVNSALAIIDTMESIKSPIVTIGFGLVASAATLLLSCGDKRFVTKRCRLMLHEISSWNAGKFHDMDVWHHEMKVLSDTIIDIYHERTKQPIAKLKSDIDRDFWMSADQAVKYGLADSVIKPASKKKGI